MSSNGTGGLSRRRVPGAIATGSGAGAFGLEDDAPSTARRSASPIVTGSRDGMRSSGEGYGYGSGGSSSHHAGPSTPRRDAYGSNGIGSPGVTSISRSRGDGASVTVTDQSGHKVAYDPRDLNDDEEAAEHPKLTLMEEVFLMGLKDRAVSSFIRWTRDGHVLTSCSFTTSRATSPSGMTTYPTHYAAPSFSSSRYVGG